MCTQSEAFLKLELEFMTYREAGLFKTNKNSKAIALCHFISLTQYRAFPLDPKKIKN